MICSDIINPFKPPWRKLEQVPLTQGRNGGAFYADDQGTCIFLKDAGIVGPWYEKSVADSGIYLGAKVAPCIIAKGVDEHNIDWTKIGSLKLAHQPMLLPDYIKSLLPPLIETTSRIHYEEKKRLIETREKEQAEITRELLKKFDANVVFVAMLGLHDASYREHIIVDKDCPETSYQIDFGTAGVQSGLGDFKQLNPYINEDYVRMISAETLTRQHLHDIIEIFYQNQDRMTTDLDHYDRDARHVDMRNIFYGQRMRIFDDAVRKIIINYGDLTGQSVATELAQHNARIEQREISVHTIPNQIPDINQVLPSNELAVSEPSLNLSVRPMPRWRTFFQKRQVR